MRSLMPRKRKRSSSVRVSGVDARSAAHSSLLNDRYRESGVVTIAPLHSLPGMKAVVEPLEGNKVKLSVEVDEQEFERALDQAFRKIAREVRVPGFRPGKAPRRILEARLGKDAARQEALREALPDYYAQALKDNAVDAIAPPEIDLTSGQESGPIAFDAVVEVRPQLHVPGYGGLRVPVPNPNPTDEEIDAQIDRLRNTGAVLQEVQRPAQPTDNVTIDLKATSA